MPTWMVVEDEPDIYDVLLAMFEIWGIEGVAFVDGAEAISWIDEVDRGTVTGELPEMAILDIRLPEASGPEVGERLRKSDRLGNMAIVMITAYRMTPADEEAVLRQAQADALMYKPLPAMPELRTKLAAIIGKRKQKAAALAEVISKPISKPLVKPVIEPPRLEKATDKTSKDAPRLEKAAPEKPKQDTP